MDPSEPRVLVVEDERPMRRLLAVALGSQGYHVDEAASCAEAIARAANHVPDLILLDLGLPDGDGMMVVKSVREWSALPIIVLSARGHEMDKVAALDEGADDYVSKPFSMAELLARVRAALRRREVAEVAEAGLFEAGELSVDLVARRVRMGEREVHLTPTEFRLLAVLVRHADKVVSHRQLLREAWGSAYQTETEYLRVYVGQLRRKLEADPTRPKYLVTEPTVGYRLRTVPF